VAADRSELNASWLSQALGWPVHGVATERIGTGQIGTTYRLHLDAEGAVDRPTRLVAKLAAEDPEARTRVADGYRKEVGFYRDLVSTLAVATPRCWYAAIADDATTFTLLLDDLAPARPGVQAEGCSIAEAEAAVENLVGLHAPRWNDASLRDHAFLASGGLTNAELLGAVHRQATVQFVDRYDGVLTADDVATLRASADATATWHAMRPEPASLVHGDYRLDNLMFGADGGVSALDWQTVGIGPAARDMAYFLGTSLATTDRRAYEMELLSGYHTALVAAGVADYDLAQCIADYRLGQLQGPLITVIGCEYATASRTAQADEMFLAMARRSCAAIRDLGSLELVG
jgi:hypothetical protein